MAVTLILLGLMARGVIAQEHRSSVWDSNLLNNYCLAVQSSESQLQGAEIRYWPLGLGVEDVNRWVWMKEDYSAWLTSIYEVSSLKCD